MTLEQLRLISQALHDVACHCDEGDPTTWISEAERLMDELRVLGFRIEASPGLRGSDE